jgi:hypothetical protein
MGEPCGIFGFVLLCEPLRKCPMGIFRLGPGSGRVSFLGEQDSTKFRCIVISNQLKK